jgi:hypothetical protein
VKIHKGGAPIRPVINWKNAAAYKLTKCWQKRAHIHPLPLPYAFNAKNTVELMNDLTDLPYDRNVKFTSLDITNMYSNVAISEIITTLNKPCEINNIEDKTKRTS